MTITLNFEDTGAWLRGDNVPWSNILIINIILSTASILQPQASALSHSFFLTCSPSHSLFLFGQRYGGDHNYVLTHGVSP